MLLLFFFQIKEPPTWNAKKKGVIENKVTKIFLSEKQSSSIKDCGKMIPCAPPVTPMPEMLNNVEFVPSLSDLRVSANQSNPPSDVRGHFVVTFWGN